MKRPLCTEVGQGARGRTVENIDAGQGEGNLEDAIVPGIGMMMAAPDQDEMNVCATESHKKPGASYHGSARRNVTPADGATATDTEEERTPPQPAQAQEHLNQGGCLRQATSWTSSRRRAIGSESLDHAMRGMKAWSRVMH